MLKEVNKMTKWRVWVDEEVMVFFMSSSTWFVELPMSTAIIVNEQGAARRATHTRRECKH